MTTAAHGGVSSKLFYKVQIRPQDSAVYRSPQYPMGTHLVKCKSAKMGMDDMRSIL